MSSKQPNPTVRTIVMLVSTIALIANLVAIIVFISGKTSFQAFFQASTPTITSPVPILTPTVASSSASLSTSTEADPVHAMAQGPLQIPFFLFAFSLGPTIVLCSSYKELFGWALGKAARSIAALLIMFILSPLISFSIYALVGVVVTVPLFLFLWSNVIAFLACLLIVQGLSKWIHM